MDCISGIPYMNIKVGGGGGGGGREEVGLFLFKVILNNLYICIYHLYIYWFRLQ